MQPYGLQCGNTISVQIYRVRKFKDIIVRPIEHLYDNAVSAVQMNGSTGEWFRTTVGVRQGRLLSPALFNVFLDRFFFSVVLEEHDGKVSIGRRIITNLRFADGIGAEEEQELEALLESLDKTCTRNKMEISAKRPNR